MPRTAFHENLQQLQDGVMTLGSMVEKAIGRAVESLRIQDVVLAQQVVDGDANINDARWELEEAAINLMATQAPMASDLRRIAAVMHIVTSWSGWPITPKESPS